MGRIKGLLVLAALLVAITVAHGQITINEGAVYVIPQLTETAPKSPKPAPAPKVPSPSPVISIAEAEQKPISGTTAPIEIKPASPPPPVAAPPPETPGYVAIFAEEPAPAPAPIPAPIVSEQPIIVPEPIAAAPIPLPVAPVPMPEQVVTVMAVPVVPAMALSEAVPNIPLPVYHAMPPSELYTLLPNVGIEPSMEATPTAPIIPLPISPAAAAAVAAAAAAPTFGAPQQEMAAAANSTASRDEFVVAPGIDMVLRDGGGANPWGIPDWSFAGYAGSNYNRASPEKQFNVMDYGAKLDGITDDAPPIQAAVDAASAQGGGVVYLPAGKFLIKNQIIISKSNVVLRGAGKTLTIIYSNYSLSDIVSDGRNIINSVGQSRFSWADGFVKITGEPLFSSNATLLGRVLEKKSRGWTSVNVDTPERFRPGMWVRLYMSDVASLPVAESLASALYDNQVESSACGVKCLQGLRGVKDMIRWAVKVKSISGNKIILERPLPMDVDPLWLAELHDLPEASMPENCGVENLGIEFALVRMKPHLKEAGFNGIAIEHALNAWVRNVAIINSDNAVVTRYSHHVTIDGIDIYANGNRTISSYNTQGHIGIGLYESSDVEVTNFNLRSKYDHDTTVRGTILCVFHNGRGIDLNLDSHRGAPFGTLYSSIDLGKATRVFSSGGAGNNGFPAGAYTTYWNLMTGSESGKPIQIPSKTAFGECTYGTKLAFQGKFVGKGCKTYYMSKKKQTPNPSDLYSSQVYKRLSGVQS